MYRPSLNPSCFLEKIFCFLWYIQVGQVDIEYIIGHVADDPLIAFLAGLPNLQLC